MNIVLIVAVSTVVVIAPWVIVYVFATKAQRAIYMQWARNLGDFSSAGNSGLGGLGNFAATLATAIGGTGFMTHMLFTRRKYRDT